MESCPDCLLVVQKKRHFISRVSEPVLDCLLDKLLEQANKARDVIDTVRRKGTEASSVLISALCEVDPYLSRVLTLR
uniref:CARD domain-containing protein n=1 Tax=Lates calcarifer TaxID=8187 RepID=A0A4W6FGD7_LATCA